METMWSLRERGEIYKGRRVFETCIPCARFGSSEEARSCIPMDLGGVRGLVYLFGIA